MHGGEHIGDVNMQCYFPKVFTYTQNTFLYKISKISYFILVY